MQEFNSFIKLYLDETYFFNGSLVVWMLLLYANVILYMIDFYALVKRKSKGETLSILAIPCLASVCGSAMVSIFVHVPVPGKLDGFSRALESGILNRILLLVGISYGIIWILTLFSQGRLSSGTRSKKEIVRWVLSCIPDYIYTVMIVFFSLWHRLTGKSFFAVGREVILWIYLYAIYFLCCKIILLVLALLVRLYSVRITVFKWREGKNPAAFLFRYFIFYQSAMVRNLLLFELIILVPITFALHDEGWTFNSVVMMAFLWLCAVFTVLFSAGPVMKALERFQVWGESRRVKEMFCREYFMQEPVFKNENYTVTRHFLVDEQSPCTFYYWPVLKSVSGWVIDEKEYIRTIFFADGTNCKILKPEADSMTPVFEYAKKWQEGNEYAHERNPVISSAESFYAKLLRVIIMILVMAFMLVPKLLK